MKINSITKKKATINPRASDTSFREDKNTFTISLLFSKISYWPKSLKLMLPLNDKLSNKTTSIGPTEHKAIKPKLFSLESLPPIVWAIPIPRAIINGTVIGPVVTPPESKAIERNAPFPELTTRHATANIKK